MSAHFLVWLRRAVVGVALAFGALHANTAAAQAILDAERVEFTPSPDHNATSGGVAVVTSYELRIYVAGSSQVTRTVNLGKPSPGSDGFIRVNFVDLLTTPLAPDVVYEARVAAVGPGGSAASAPSNQFGFSPACSPTLSASSASVAASASSGSVNVSAAAGCAWSASSPVNWITIGSGASGVGPGTVTFNVSANLATTSRSATLTIATRSFTVTQAAAAAPAPCEYTISPNSRSSPAGGETVTVAVTTDSTCTWAISSNASWLTFSGSASRTGPGNVSVTVAANSSSSSRSGSVTIAGRTFSVNQAAPSAPAPCQYTISPTSRSSPAAGETVTVAVSTGSTCTWSIGSNASWLTFSGSSSRTGPANVSVTVATNSSSSSRSGSVTIAGHAFSVNQAGAQAPCEYTISPPSRSSPAAGETVTVAVSTGSTCTWSIRSNASWLTFSGSSSRTGPGNVSVTVAGNSSSSSRSGSVTIAGRTFSVTQSGGCSYSVTPSQLTPAAGGSKGTINVTTGAGCSWSTTGVPSWIAVSTGTRTGSGSVSYTVDANPTTSVRTGSLTVAGRSISVSQAAASNPTRPRRVRVVTGSGTNE